MTIQTGYSPELADLMEHEKVIEQGLATFVEVGWALLKIKDGKKYQAAGYQTFEDYCQKRWQWSRDRGYQLIQAAQTVKALPTMVGIPTSERQARALTPLKDDPKKMAEAWDEAVEVSNGSPTAAIVEEVVARHRASPPISKPKFNEDGVSHPARFHDVLIPIFAEILEGYPRVLDPFAGTGRIHELRDHGFETEGVEIEPEWAELHSATRIGDALELPFPDAEFDAICTSPTYGNRLADHHNASDPELRRSYTHDLGRPLHPNNSGSLQWGEEYEAFHRAAWREAIRVLRPGGLFVFDIKDHVREWRVQPVAFWHVATLALLGLRYVEAQEVPAPGLRQGENRDLRTPLWAVTMQKEEAAF